MSGPVTRANGSGPPGGPGHPHDPADPVPVPASADAAVLDAARRFVSAVIWGEHITLWGLFTDEARRSVLRIAVGRGMDEALAARLRDGTAARVERDTFLADLVNGLRADLRGNDLDALEYQPDATTLDDEVSDPGAARVMLMAPMLAGLGAPLPVASMEMVRDGDQWRVERLTPRTSA